MLNVLILGVGQCGNRILDAINKEAFESSLLSKYYRKRKFVSNIETLAVNTAINDLKELRFTRAMDRIHIPFLHGVGANRTIGKQCFENNKDLLLKVIEERGDFDLAFIIASASGGTGSSFLPPLIEAMKEKYRNNIYGIIVLPSREEGSLYLQNSVFCLKEVMEGSSDGNILIDNQFLKYLGKDMKSAYDGINKTIAERIFFLLKALDSEMMMVTDLGDFKTVMSGGSRLAAMGFGKGKKNFPIKSIIKQSLSPDGLLFKLDPYHEASRAMVVIEGDQKYFNTIDITNELENLSEEMGQVIKGIIIRKGALPKVLTVLSISESKEFEKLLHSGIDAFGRERTKKEFLAGHKKNLREQLADSLADFEPHY